MLRISRCTGLKAFLMYLLFVVLLLVGCSGKQSVEGQGSTAVQESGKTVQYPEKDASSLSGITPVTLDWFVSEGYYDKRWDTRNNLMDQRITEKTGVSVNFIVPSGSGEEKINTMIASNDLPDILSMPWWLSQVHQLETAGKLRPLNELIANYAPTFQPPQSMISWYTREDGNWYGFPNFFTAPERMTEKNWLESNTGMVARKDIMDQLGIKAEDFTSMESTIAALKKVRDAGVSYNGKKVIPIFLGGNGGLWDTFAWELPEMLAIPMEDRDGNLLNIKRDPKFKEMYLFGNALFRENLASKDNFTMIAQDKIPSGEVFCVISNISDIMSSIYEAYRSDQSMVWVPVGPIRDNAGSEPRIRKGTMNGWLLNMISAKSAKADRAIRLFEYLYSDEAQMLNYFGIENETYTMDNGRIRWIPKYLEALAEDKEKVKKLYSINDLWFFADDLIRQRFAPIEETPEEKIGVVIRKYFAPFVFDDRAFDGLDPKPGEPLEIKTALIREYWERNAGKLLLARDDGEFNQLYDEIMQHMDDLGMKEVNRYMNEKFKANKEKLGIRYSWYKE